MTPPTSLVSRLPLAEAFDAEYLEQWEIFPLEIVGDVLRVAVVGEPAVEVLDDLERSYEARLELIPVASDALRDAIRRAFNAATTVVEVVKDLDAAVTADEGEGEGEGEGDGEAEGDEMDARNLIDQPPVVRYVSALIAEAHAKRASDIHFDATPQGLQVRQRVDGVLRAVRAPGKGNQTAVVSRIKLMANLDIAERRAPQDGRSRIRLEELALDIRVSTVPTLHGESVVLRLLDRGARPLALEQLGMSAELREQFTALAQRPHGILLATGPTGSGKTTTLYAAVGLLDRAALKIITVEDPIEYRLDGVTQVPVNVKAGMTFASALRSLLRQDPNVLMIGEMRDPETAAVAIGAAMTGQLVYSTLHTNDAVSAVTRLADLEVEPYRVASALDGVLAQRLVRRTCAHCRAPYTPPASALAALGGPRADLLAGTFVRGAGCHECDFTGYRERIGLFELLVISEPLRQAIARNRPLAELRVLARREGTRTLREDGWDKVQQGETTVEEVLRVTDH
jgi:type II secretory ATPase GspE/PulE/Tfp pilus assembly ATPase PilB-like protein